jgi:two-component system sensor histidine kinase KdpD
VRCAWGSRLWIRPRRQGFAHPPCARRARPAGMGIQCRHSRPWRRGRTCRRLFFDRDKPGPLLTPDERRLLDALIDQGALAIERVRLVEDMDRVKRTVETDRLRSALLTSISHDLKTPLAAVLGSASTLRNLAGKLTEAEKADLLATIVDESAIRCFANCSARPRLPRT